MTTMTGEAPATCTGREGKYVPWSMGEVFTCSTCGARVRQSHRVQPLVPGKRSGYESVYPIPEHVTAATPGC